jgi:hypothetical protein
VQVVGIVRSIRPLGGASQSDQAGVPAVQQAIHRSPMTYQTIDFLIIQPAAMVVQPNWVQDKNCLLAKLSQHL